MTFVTVTTGDNSPLPLPDHMSLRQAHQHVKESDTKHNCCSIKGLQLDILPTLLGQSLRAPAGVSFFYIRKVTLTELERLFGLARSNSSCSSCQRYTEICIYQFLFSFHQFWNLQVNDASKCIFCSVPFCFRAVVLCVLMTFDFFSVSCLDFFYQELLFCCQGINLISYYIIQVGIHWKTLWTTFHLFCSLFIDNIYFKIRHSDFNYS